MVLRNSLSGWYKTAGLVVGFIAIYFFLRLANLTAIPIFTDEAIYIRWSQIGARDAAWRFISLVDGKQPLFTWIMMVLFRILPAQDPLFVGRLASVLAGLGSLVGIWLLAYELFKSKRVAFFSSLLYLISPFSLVYDRMALYDSLVAALSIWNLFFAVRLARFPRLDTALLLGMSLALGMLNKSSGFLSLYLLPLTLFVFNWNRKNLLKRLSTWAGYAIIATVLSQALYSMLRLSPFFYMISRKDSVFIYSIEELKHVISYHYLYWNIHGVFDWLYGYLSTPLFILTFVPLVLYKKQIKEKILLYAWWFVPFIGLAVFGKVLYPRFIFFMTMPLFVLIAVTFDEIVLRLKHLTIVFFVILVVLIPSLYTDYLLLVDPKRAPIPQADSGQYINDWPSGWGVREIVERILSESKQKKITLYTDGTFGLFPYAFEIYLVDKPNIEIIGMFPLPMEMPKEVILNAKANTTYFVFNQTDIPPVTWQLELIESYQKGIRRDRSMKLYRVLVPEKENKAL